MSDYCVKNEVSNTRKTISVSGNFMRKKKEFERSFVHDVTITVNINEFVAYVSNF